MDPRNRHKVKSNLPHHEVAALKELIKWHNDHKIVIKACDKGAGMIIQNFEDYMRACYEHLGAYQTQEDGTVKPYYTRVDNFEIVRAKNEIT